MASVLATVEVRFERSIRIAIVTLPGKTPTNRPTAAHPPTRRDL